MKINVSLEPEDIKLILCDLMKIIIDSINSIQVINLDKADGKREEVRRWHSRNAKNLKNGQPEPPKG